MKRILCYILLLIFTGVLIYAGWNYFTIREDYEQGRDTYASLEQYVSFVPPVTATHTEATTTDGSEEAPTEHATLPPTESVTTLTVNFDLLRKINPDIVAWIYVEGTGIHYPVVQGEDNEYYLDRLFDGTYNESGTIFLDAHNAPDFTDRNSVLYGHYMKDGSMFHDIRSYRDPSYYTDHPTGILVTPQGSYRIEFFSGYITDTLGNGWDLQFSGEDYGQWLRELEERSLFEPYFHPHEDDRILTLSTCSYEFQEARFVLHGILCE